MPTSDSGLQYRTAIVNLQSGYTIPIITISQYDENLPLRFVVYDGLEVADLYGGSSSATIQGTRPGGVQFSVDCESITGNVVTARSTLDMSREHGSIECELRFTYASALESWGTANFYLEVEQSTYTDESLEADTQALSLIAQQVHADTVQANGSASQAYTNALAAAQSANQAAQNADLAFAAVESAEAIAEDAEAWARGTRDGAAVGSTDETYHNNSKYYSEQASQAALDAGSYESSAHGWADEASGYATAAAQVVANSVRWDTAQTLTDAQKAQARTNIGAVSSSDIPSGTVRYDATQSLTDEQKLQARSNIGAPSDSAVANEFSTSTAYAVGDLIMYQTKLYRFTAAHAAGAWNASHVEEASVFDELTVIKGDLSDLEDSIEHIDVGGVVKYDEAQILTQAQQGQAQVNLGLMDYEFSHLDTTWKRATLNPNTGGEADYQALNRLVSDYIQCENSVVLKKTSSSNKHMVYTYDSSKNFISPGNWVNDERIAVSQNGTFYIRVLLSKTSDAEIATTEIDSIANTEYMSSGFSQIDNGFVRYDSTQNLTEQEKAQARINIGINQYSFVHIDTTWTKQSLVPETGAIADWDATNRLLSGFISCNGTTILKKISSTQQHMMYLYDSNKSFIQPGEWSSEDTVTITRDGDYYVRILLRKSDNTNIETSEITTITGNELISYGDIENSADGCVRYDIAQNLSSSQKNQAKANLGISDSEDVQEDFHVIDTTWEKAALNPNTGAEDPDVSLGTNRLLSDYVLCNGIVLLKKTSTAQQHLYYLYDDNQNFLESNLWSSEETIVINRNGNYYIRVYLRKSDNSIIEQSEINTLTSNELMMSYGPTNSVFSKFRIAIWNIGHFSFGDYPNTTITQNDYQEKLNAFRTLLNDVSPDILCIAEYSSVFAVVSGTNISAKTALLDNYGLVVEGEQHNYSCNAIASNIQISGLHDNEYECNKSLSSSNGVSPTDYRYFHGTFSLNGEYVHIFSTHCGFDRNDASVEVNQHQELISLASGYEHAIILGDMNAIHSVNEFDAFTNAGYTIANHGYLGDIRTFSKDDATIPNKVLDNIMVKGLCMTNIKVTQTNLSDHYVLSCELSLYN